MPVATTPGSLREIRICETPVIAGQGRAARRARNASQLGTGPGDLHPHMPIEWVLPAGSCLEVRIRPACRGKVEQAIACYDIKPVPYCTTARSCTSGCPDRTRQPQHTRLHIGQRPASRRCRASIDAPPIQQGADVRICFQHGPNLGNGELQAGYAGVAVQKHIIRLNCTT